MRLQNGNTGSETTSDEIPEFSSWILKVGDGKLGDGRDGFADIEIPEDNLIYNVGDSIAAILESIYPSIADNYRTDKSGGNGELVSVDFLNSIKCSGLPNHRLVLKEGVSIMLLRNIDQKSGFAMERD
ncbi:hypothetical protein ACS0TY_030868 [Phlomoides rotata]